jgi:hypothetical protein
MMHQLSIFASSFLLSRKNGVLILVKIFALDHQQVDANHLAPKTNVRL